MLTLIVFPLAGERRPGTVGLPLPGVTVKTAPSDDAGDSQQDGPHFREGKTSELCCIVVPGLSWELFFITITAPPVCLPFSDRFCWSPAPWHINLHLFPTQPPPLPSPGTSRKFFLWVEGADDCRWPGAVSVDYICNIGCVDWHAVPLLRCQPLKSSVDCLRTGCWSRPISCSVS